MDLRSGSYPAKKHRHSVRSGYQTRQDLAVRVFGRVTTRTEPNRRPKTGPLAGYPDPLLTLPSTAEAEKKAQDDEHTGKKPEVQVESTPETEGESSNAGTKEPPVTQW